MRKVLPLFLCALAVADAQDAVQVGSYLFQGNLDSQRAASQPLIPTNPSGNNRFVTDTVLGQSRMVYDIQGAASPLTAQGGLTYLGKDKVDRDRYSVEILFTFTGADKTWRRIFDPHNRRSSSGLYLDPSNYLDYYSGVQMSPAVPLATGTYHHVVLVKKPGELLHYYNGKPSGSRAGGTLLGQITADTNPDQLLHLFLDDSPEWGPARIALFRVYNGDLTAAEVAQIYTSPFTSTVGLPRPGFQSSGIVNSASYASTNAISSGGFFSIFGTDLADAQGDWGQSFVNNNAPKRLNNVRVLVNDLESSVVFTSAGQVNALAPDNLPDGPVTVVVENGTLRSTVVSSQARRINPAVFRFNPMESRYMASTANDGSAYIAPSNLFGTNGSLNGLAVRPARPGEYIVLYGTGLGPTTPGVPSGQIPTARDGGYPIANTAEIRLTSSTGQMTTVRPAYAGLSGFPGLHQVVFQVPEVANGEYETVLVVAGQASPARTYLPISR